MSEKLSPTEMRVELLGNGTVVLLTASKADLNVNLIIHASQMVKVIEELIEKSALYAGSPIHEWFNSISVKN